MSAIVHIFGSPTEAGAITILARVTSLFGTGPMVRDAEGPCLTPADVTSISVRVFTLAFKDSPEGTEVLPAPAARPDANLFDTLRTVGWPIDPFGYNLALPLPPSSFRSPGQWHAVAVRFALTSGHVAWLKCQVRPSAVLST